MNEEIVETLPPEGEIVSKEYEGDIVSADDIEIVDLPLDLKDLDPIKDQDSFVSVLVNKWNSIVSNLENQTILFSKMVVKALEGQTDNTVTEVVQKIKSHPDLKLTISKDRIWQGVRLIKARPDLVSAPRVNTEDQDYYRKKDGTKNYEFYFELYKYNIPEGMRAYFETLGKSRGWSVRQLRENILDYREDKLTPQESLRMKKREHIKEIILLVRYMKPEGVEKALTQLRELYNEFKYPDKKSPFSEKPKSLGQ